VIVGDEDAPALARGDEAVARARKADDGQAIDARHDRFGLQRARGHGRRTGEHGHDRCGDERFPHLLASHPAQRIRLEVRELAAHAEPGGALSSKLAKASVYAPELRS
jgi:hypothetical protein